MSRGLASVATVAVALVGTLVACLLGLSLTDCASATPGPADVAVYSSELGVCVARATDYDAGEACLRAVRSLRCGPGGLWSDSGSCPDGGGL